MAKIKYQTFKNVPSKIISRGPCDFKNSAVKARVMKKRSVIKNSGKGLRLGDDVTRWNAVLLNQLNAHASIDQAWYFNGAVYAADKSGKRPKFDLNDDIGLKLRSK